MAVRNYNMSCSIAKALDLIGERWTLLLIRELLTGPKRYKDLNLGLSGIGTNLLADRLKSLLDMNIIRKTKIDLGTAYELTKAGKELEPALIYLSKWGLKYGRNSEKDDLNLPYWNLLAFKALFDPKSAQRVFEIYEIHVGDYIFSIRVRDGEIETKEGADWNPSLTLKLTNDAFTRLANRETELDDEIKNNEATINGSESALEHFQAIFSLKKLMSKELKLF